MEIKTRYARDLGLLEKYQLSIPFNGTRTGTNVTGRFEHPPRQGGMTDRFAYTTLLAPAIVRLLNRHPILSVVLRDIGSPKVHFEFLSHIDLYNMIRFTNHNSSVGAEQMRLIPWEFGFDHNSIHPLWNITICPIHEDSCYITLAVHHIISDKIGVWEFWNELIKEVFASFVEETFKEIEEKLQRDDNHYFVQLPSDLKLEPSYEHYNSPKPSFFTDTLPFAFDLIGSKILPVTSWEGDSLEANSLSKYLKVKTFRVYDDKWVPLMKKAEEKKIPTDAVVFVSALLAWTKVYPKCCETVETMTPVDCRPLSNPSIPETQIGNFTSFYSTFWTNNPDLRKYQNNPWDLAKKYYHDLQKNKVDSAKQVLLLKHLPEYPSVSREFMGFTVKTSDMTRHSGIEISNLGSFEQTDLASGWKLWELYLLQKPRFSKSYVINSVTTRNILYCTLNYEEGLLKDKNANQLIDGFMSVINRFLEK